jgi:hypothetical protein
VVIRRLIAPLTFVAVALHAGQAFAQDAFPAPLPDQKGPVGNTSPIQFANETQQIQSRPLTGPGLNQVLRARRRAIGDFPPYYGGRR